MKKLQKGFSQQKRFVHVNIGETKKTRGIEDLKFQVKLYTDTNSYNRLLLEHAKKNRAILFNAQEQVFQLVLAAAVFWQCKNFSSSRCTQRGKNSARNTGRRNFTGGGCFPRVKSTIILLSGYIDLLVNCKEPFLSIYISNKKLYYASTQR